MYLASSASLLLISTSHAAFAFVHPRQNDPSQFDWSSIAPSPNIEYHPCYDTFRCARLQVPMDWTHSTNQSIAIAIVTLPATVPVTDPSFGGTILMNPGGPGASATAAMRGSGTMLQGVFDGKRHYEILGFDPRGVGSTTPGLDCFGDELSRWIHAPAQSSAFGNLHPDTENLITRVAFSKGYNEQCESRVREIGKHVSTASVARDMLEIVDKVAEEKQRNDGVTMPLNEPTKLLYAGFSYGTFLGMTFASMFPERVGRMLLDGVVDAEDYTSWSINDAEEGLQTFYKACFELGSSCPLVRQNDTDWAAMKARVDNLMAELEHAPTTVSYENNIFIISSLDIDAWIRSRLTRLHVNSFALASSLDQFLSGNFSAMHTELIGPRPSSDIPTISVSVGDARPAIGCSDVLPEHYAEVTAFGTDFLESAITDLQAQSPTMGASWSLLAVDCVGRQHRPAYAFSGPWTGPAIARNTTSLSSPILFINPTLDPSTPLRNAYRMAQNYPGAVVAEQEVVGHSALFAAPSECMAEIVNAYFEMGKLPANGTRCASGCDLFGECDAANAD